jgi:capsular exopolysaccharide synthesis family protein
MLTPYVGPGGPGFGPAAQESIIRRYWRVMLKRRLIIAAAIVACVIAGVALAMMTQPRYAASATIEIAREAEQVVDLGEEKSRVSAGSTQEFYQTQYALLRSRALALAVVRALRLAQNNEFLTNYGEADPADLPRQREVREQMATGIVMGNTEIIPVRMSSVVNVRHNSPNPQMAAAIANSLATNFIEMNLSRRYESSSYARTFLQNQLTQLRQRLEASERQAVAYAAQNGIINLAPTTTSREPGQQQATQSLESASLGAANAALADARTARIAAESRYRQSGTGQTEALTNPTLNALRSQRAEVGAQHQRLLSDFGPEYPTVRATAAQLAELDRQIGVESRRVTGAVTGETARQYRQALAAEQELAQRVEQLKSGVLDLRRRSIQYDILQRDVDTNRQMYDTVLQQYRQVGIAGGVGTNNISVVDRALVPGGPYRPSLAFNIMVALLIGTVLGALIALLLEQLDESAILPEDFQNKLGVSLIGSVPVIEGGHPIESLNDPKSPVSEAYFSVLTRLQFSTTHGTPKTLLVTSTQPGEGKSTTAFAIAQGLAKLGKQVLLIDGDMRNPSVHKMRGLENRAGLSNLLTGDGTIEQHAAATDVPNLSIVTAGPIPPNPAELLAGEKLREVLAAAEAHFDHVVVDGPPILGLADAPLLARSTEATVFALEAGRTKAGQARQALQRLAAIQAPVVGAVLTKFHAQREGYGYGYDYAYQYSYGARSAESADR